ncbi:hypothetical protein R1flu_004341 [Riccia fluitans]|uniref:Uncharacterized protein n=1 Tax=Riccia fluitans TaxID=41844 RepID=A0ABD1YT25_9MARC
MTSERMKHPKVENCVTREEENNSVNRGGRENLSTRQRGTSWAGQAGSKRTSLEGSAIGIVDRGAGVGGITSDCCRGYS